jgi:hypothetical protein
MVTIPRRLSERLLIVLVAFTISGLALAQAPASQKAVPGNHKQPAAQTKANENYRVVTEADGLSCSFSQDIATSMGIVIGGLEGESYINPGPPKSGVTMWSKENHFQCKDKTGTQREIELINKVPNLSVDFDHKNGRVVIKTRDFGTVYRDEDNRALEMTESQIKKLQTFLGF